MGIIFKQRNWKLCQNIRQALTEFIHPRRALSYSADSCFIRRYTRTLAGVCKQKSLDKKALNYIPTSWSREKFLVLVTFLNLAIIYMVTFPLKFKKSKLDALNFGVGKNYW